MRRSRSPGGRRGQAITEYVIVLLAVSTAIVTAKGLGIEDHLPFGGAKGLYDAVAVKLDEVVRKMDGG